MQPTDKNGAGASAENERLEDAEIIHAYTREEGIKDGYLVDTSDLAREAGVKFPMTLSRAAWEKAVAVSAGEKRLGQDEVGRLWDVLSVFRFAARRTSGARLDFSVSVQRKAGKWELVRLKSVIGPIGPFDPSPCITIMLPEED